MPQDCGRSRRPICFWAHVGRCRRIRGGDEGTHSALLIERYSGAGEGCRLRGGAREYFLYVFAVRFAELGPYGVVVPAFRTPHNLPRGSRAEERTGGFLATRHNVGFNH